MAYHHIFEPVLQQIRKDLNFDLFFWRELCYQLHYGLLQLKMELRVRIELTISRYKGEVIPFN